MGRYSPQYTEAQRTAVVRAIVEEGMTATEAVEAAANGRSGSIPSRCRRRRLEAWSANTAWTMDSTNRQATTTTLPNGSDRALSILEARIDALYESPGAVDLVELQRIARATREVQKLAFAVAPTNAPGQLEEERPSSDFAALVRREAAAADDKHHQRNCSVVATVTLTEAPPRDAERQYTTA